jgi:hypothetical protein
VSVNADHEEEGQVVCVPEGFETLLADLVVCGCVHEHHDQEHEMASNSTRLSVVNLLGGLLADLCVDVSDGPGSDNS